MRFGLLAVLILGALNPLPAQTIISGTGTRGRAYARFGIEPATVVTVGYQHTIPLTLIQREVSPYAEWTMSALHFRGQNADFTFGGVLPITESGKLKLVTNLHFSAGSVVTRNFESHRIAAGDEMAVGIYGNRWFVAVTGEYEHVFLARIEHTDFYRSNYYPDAVDGWYWDPGGTFQLGLEGGRTIQERYDLHLEVKVPFTEAFNAFGGSPLHVNFGFGVRVGS